jgi:YD repeat-containing protein
MYACLAISPLVDNLVFATNGTTVMTTTKACDILNRLTNIVSEPIGSSAIAYRYAYNAANQRTSITNLDNARWVYQYDSLGQVTSGKKYWSDGTPVAGQHLNTPSTTSAIA